MKSLRLLLVIFAAAIAPRVQAAAETRAQMKTEAASAFPDNTSHTITPADVRTFTSTLIDSAYNALDDGTAVLTSDSRLSNARTPTAHASSHASAGSDPLTLAQSQVTGLTTALSGKASVAGAFGWRDIFSRYPLLVPVRGFLGQYKDFGSGNVPTTAWIDNQTLFIQGTIGLNSGDITYGDAIFDLPTGFESPTNNLATVAIFTSDSGYHPTPGFVATDVSLSPIAYPVSRFYYPGTITTFVFSQFSSAFGNSTYIAGGMHKVLGSGGTLDDVSVLVPQPLPDNGAGVKVCVYFHGTGDDYISHVSSVTGATSTQRLMRSTLLALLSDGWIVVGLTDGAMTTHWGNPNSWTATQNALNWITSTLNVSKLVCLGQSMGGLSSLRAVAQYSGITKWYGIYPCTNLDWLYQHSGFTSSMNTAFGSSDHASFLTASSGCDPMTFTLSQFAGKDFKMTSSASDTLVDKTNNSDAFATRISGTAHSVTVTAVSGDHGDPSAFIPSAVVTFFDAP